jgi:putative RNA 2'-phosphotransferase
VCGFCWGYKSIYEQLKSIKISKNLHTQEDCRNFYFHFHFQILENIFDLYLSTKFNTVLNMQDYNKISKFLSLVLRHKPDEIGVILDSNGWANVQELLTKLQAKEISINFETLQKIVESSDKQRFSFNQDLTKIRANQGHSIAVDVELVAKIPPDILYHGTTSRFLDSIMESGLQKMQRLHVHLTHDIEIAKKVGIRHGKLAILKIDAKSMQQESFIFFCSENNVWLCDNIPSKYISKISS